MKIIEKVQRKQQYQATVSWISKMYTDIPKLTEAFVVHEINNVLWKKGE